MDEAQKTSDDLFMQKQSEVNKQRDEILGLVVQIKKMLHG
jgi:hypothetical protein